MQSIIIDKLKVNLCLLSKMKKIKIKKRKPLNKYNKINKKILAKQKLICYYIQAAKLEKYPSG